MSLHASGTPDRSDRNSGPAPSDCARPESPTASFRVLLGTALQKQRLRRGLTQAQAAEFADLSTKYVGEIERGEANTTLDAIERLAEATGWDPMNVLEGIREPITEGIRVLLLSEMQQIVEGLKTMVRWLQALDPVKQSAGRLPTAGPPFVTETLSHGRAHPRARSSKPRDERKQLRQKVGSPSHR